MPRLTNDSGRHTRPRDRDWLWSWLKNNTGVSLACKGVCEGHSAQIDVFADLWLNQPPDMLLLGARGSGKSFMSALHCHMRSRFYPQHGTRILGGAKSQAKQVLAAFKEAVLSSVERDQIERSAVEFIRYKNGSEVEILTASETSVRGPHVPDLKLDEVDEIDKGLREAAYGMVMEKGRCRELGVKITVLKTSTWHNLGGPMQELIDRANEENREKPGSYPFYKFCLFDVLERCPDETSGPNLEYCPACPLMAYCHADKDRHGGVPKAKRARGHYTIDAAIHKIRGVSKRTFEADYLCMGPKADGVWFSDFDTAANVSEDAEYSPGVPVQMALDTGLHTGGVFFQIRRPWVGNFQDVEVNVFADYFGLDQVPEVHVNTLKRIAGDHCQGLMEKRWTDPAGRARNAIGSVALGEYTLAGMTFHCWPAAPVKDGLTMLEGLVRDATGRVRLKIHPRCRLLIQAFQSYRRATLRGQLCDWPEDPQHNAEDLMDALRGGLIGNFPEGRLPEPRLTRVPATRIF